MKKGFILITLITVALMSGMAQTCDSLFNLRSSQDTMTLISANTDTTAGYLSGNNEYGDLAKAEAFPVADSGYYITSATIYFGAIAINPTDTFTTVMIMVWDNTGISLLGGSAPGVILDSVQVTLGQIAQAVSAGAGLQVYFTGDSVLTTDTIYVGVVLPFITGDTVAILTNNAPPGPDGNGYDLNANGLWNSYNSDWGVTSGSLGNYIEANICSSPPAPPSAYFAVTSGNASGACSPTSISFSDSSGVDPADASYTYSFGDGNFSNTPNSTDTYIAGGMYTVTESVLIDTGSVFTVLTSATQTISVTSSPVITAIATAPTSDTTFGYAYITVANGTGHYFITWSDGTTDDTLQNAAPGVYTVTVQDQNGCAGTDTVFIPYPLGILGLSASQQVKVYPIPATNTLNLIWSQGSNTEVAIIDAAGKEVKSITSIGEINTALDIRDLTAGAYILRLTDRSSRQQQSTSFTIL